MPVTSPRDFPSWMRMVERKLNELTTTGRGPLLTYIDTGGGEGTLDRRTPATPTSVTYQPSIYYLRSGDAQAQVTVTVAPVTKATNGTDMTVDYYELSGREWDGFGEAPPYLAVATSFNPNFIAQPFEPGTTWQFRVRAVGATTLVPGGWSAEQFVSMQEDTTPPPRPSTPTVTVVSGVFRVEWDGLTDAGGAMPADFAYVEIAAGTVSSPQALTGRRMRGAGVEVFTNARYGQTWYFRLRAVDTSGNVSPWSANASGRATPLVDIGGVTVEDVLAEQQEVAQNAADAAVVARGTATARRADADLAASDRDTAQAEADAAHTNYLNTKAEQDPVMLAETGRTSIAYDGVAPTGDPAVLWIDTSTSTAMIWDGAAWAPANDPEVDAALALVLDAQSTWNQQQAEADIASLAADEAAVTATNAEAAAAQAETDARTALENATATYQSAAGSSRITYSINEPDPAYEGHDGDTWFRRDETGRVIGYWEWTGGAWATRTVASEVVANLDVGKLTAGAATIDTLAAQQIAADTGEFLRARAEWFQANRIEADWIGSGAVQAQHIGVGAVAPEALVFGVEELSPNPMWIDTAMRLRFPAGAAMVYDNTAALLQRGQNFVLTATPSTTRTMALSVPIPCTPGELFYLRHESRHTGADWAPSLTMEFFSADGTPLTPASVVADALDPIDTYRPYEDVLTAPAGAATVSLAITAPAGTAGSWSISATSWRRVLASTGPSGQRLEISPAAIRLWGATDEGQASVEISTTGAEVITLRSTQNDDSTIVLNGDQGHMSALSVSAAASMSYRGTELSTLLNAMPRGVVARATTAQVRATMGNITTEVPITELRYDIPAGVGRRVYYVRFNHAGVGGTLRQTYFRIRETVDGSQPTSSSWAFITHKIPAVNHPMSTTFGANRVYNDGTTVRLRVSIAPGASGSGGVEWHKEEASEFYLVDEGPEVPATGTVPPTDGTSTSTPTASYTSAETVYKWEQSYRGDGSRYTYAEGEKNYQGYYLSSNGVLKSAIGAPDQMFADLAGATVEWIRVYLYASHWYLASGGTAVLGVHGSSTEPTTFPGITGAESHNFARAEGKWIYLPSAWHASFKSGAYRGITLHANNSTSSQYYGYFAATATKWQWKYTK